MSEEQKKERFYWGGISDAFLVNGQMRYLRFFEADEPYKGAPVGVGLKWKLFPSRNGFHAIDSLTNAQGKHVWWRKWKEKYPSTDYKFKNEMVLAPHSEEEAEWIYRLAPNGPRIVRYYRDKAVLETFKC